MVTEIPLKTTRRGRVVLSENKILPYVQYLDSPIEDMRRFFTKEELKIGADALVNFRGIRAAGKTSWTQMIVTLFPERVTFMPMVMTRPLRPAMGNMPAEVSGRDYIYMSEEEFDKRRQAGEFLLSFLLWDLKEVDEKLVWRATRAGILVDTVRKAILTKKKVLSIISPGPDYYLWKRLFPAMRIVVIEPATEDYDLYLESRNITDKALDALAMMNRHRAIYDMETWHPNTEIMVNARWRITPNSDEMARLKRWILAPRLYRLRRRSRSVAAG